MKTYCCACINLESECFGNKFFPNKWWNFSLNIVHSEVSDRSIKLEDQNVQSSSQVQLKKQKSLGAEIFTSKYNDYNHHIILN